MRNVGILTGGTVLAQALAALSLPLLTRLYAPEDFSLLAVYMALIGIISAVSCLRLNIAIPLPEEDTVGMALVALSVLFATMLSIFLALPVVFAPEMVAGWLGQAEMTPYLWMIPAGVWIASVYTALQYWASRHKRFGLITRTRVTRALSGAGVQLGFGFVAPGPFGLLFGHMIYGGMGVFGLLRSTWLEDREALRNLSSASLWHSLQEYRRFPIWSVPETLFNTASIQLPVMIIAAAAAGPEAGFLLLAMRVMGIPMGLIGSSVAQVYLAEAGQKLREGTLGRFTRKTMAILFKTGAPPLLLVGVISPFIFEPIFGEEWGRAGWLIAWMTPWFILQFVASPVSMVLHVTGRLRLALVVTFVGLLLRLTIVMLSMGMFPQYVSELYAVSGALFCVIYLAAILWVVDRSPLQR